MRRVISSKTAFSSSRIAQLTAQLTTTITTTPVITTTTTTIPTSRPITASHSGSTGEMAMATEANPGPAPAPWRDLFLEHIATMPTPEFVLSTVHRIPLPSSSSSSSSSPPPQYTYVPRARTCVFRGLWAELPTNPKNEGPLNPRGVYGSDLPTFTTDARMAKVGELWGCGEGEQGQGEGQGERGSSGGGAHVEAVWWAPGPKTQWRVRGPAYLLAADDAEGSRAEVKVRARMRRLVASSPRGDQTAAAWSFAREVAAHFANLSPAMRGSFRNPPPGAPVDAPVPDGRLRLGQKVTRGLEEDEVARANFRVVVVLPAEVDRCDLSDPERPRRWVYRFVGGGEGEGTWEKVEVWP
ncbi:hypothetical protein F4775DRAFT_311715 [Biscogniauxia sp. FL1348]|nr:hypothetical protein F4775DRAFT_311715 [Biscogniauxia sp. FL1348]